MNHKPDLMSAQRAGVGRRMGWMAALLVLAISGCGSDSGSEQQPPNIIFFILDDVGIDQMTAFGYGGTVDVPQTPVIDTLVKGGVIFRNTWAMAECSPSRAMFFNGRYPIRTGITDAILPSDLAQSQMSPYESTTPAILKSAGYASGIFGKTHFTGSADNPSNNPYGATAQFQLGWDQFSGWGDGAPNSIDTTAGGVATTGISYPCGYVPGTTSSSGGTIANGADAGACYTIDNRCSQLSSTAYAPGRTCLESGGIFVPNGVCTSPRPANLDFTLQNGYYVGDLLFNDSNGQATSAPPDDPSGKARGYRSTLEANLAIDWIKSRSKNQPWMATVSFSTAHTPYQPPPTALLPSGTPAYDGTSCTSGSSDRTLATQMIESMDREIGRVLVESGVATRNADGSIAYDPAQSNTMVVVIGDNGSYVYNVKEPFDPKYAKGYVNQTGVWVPLLVAGPLVVQPGRSVDAMVNVADLFALFGEIAGINVRDAVPAAHALDAESMLPYLTDPGASPIRDSNFTHLATNARASTTVQGACVLVAANACTTLFPRASVCSDEGGVWYGSGTTVPGVPTGGFTTCCQVNEFLLAQTPPQSAYPILPDVQQAVRNSSYKLLRIVGPEWVPANGTAPGQCVTNEQYQFYRIDQATPIPRIDRPTNPGANNLGTIGLTGEDLSNYNWLLSELQSINNSVVDCPGDGNLDGVVDAKDVEDYNTWATRSGGTSTWFDFNLDGKTDGDDLATIRANLGKTCAGSR
jgi:hypothetical protein